jgi:hypothetical protein
MSIIREADGSLVPYTMRLQDVQQSCRKIQYGENDFRDNLSRSLAVWWYLLHWGLPSAVLPIFTHIHVYGGVVDQIGARERRVLAMPEGLDSVTSKQRARNRVLSARA